MIYNENTNFAKGEDNNMEAVYGNTAYSAIGRSDEHIKDTSAAGV